MNTITSVVKRHPLAAFFILAYTFSWLPWLIGSLAPAIAPFVSYPFFTPGPLLAALIVIPIAQGRAGLRALGASMLKWRVGWSWYALALGVPLAVAHARRVGERCGSSRHIVSIGACRSNQCL